MGLFCFLRRHLPFSRRSDDGAEHDDSRKDGDRDDSDSPPSPLDALVDEYLKNDMIDIPLVPDFVERRVYKTVLATVLDEGKEALRTTSLFSLLNHDITCDVYPSRGELGGAGDRDDDEEEARHHRATAAAVAARKRKTKEDRQAQRILIDHYVQKFVNEIGLHSSFFVPEHLEKKLYANIISLVVAVVDDTLQHAFISVLGHRVTFHLAALPLAAVAASQQQKQRQRQDQQKQESAAGDNDEAPKKAEEPQKKDVTSCPSRRRHLNTILEEHGAEDDAIGRLVDAKLERHGISFVPDVFERHVYRTAFKILVGILRETVNSAEIGILHHRVRLHMVAQPEPHAEA